jgi:RecA/RadA recombinase
VSVRQRCLPVHDVLADLLPDGGLPRGRILGCGGVAAWSLALALVARAAAAGSWMAVVGAPTLGIEAIAEHGIALERVVYVDADRSSWAERVAAAADGFDLIVTVAPAGAERVVRRVRQRLQVGGAVIVAVDSGTPTVGCDLDFSTGSPMWLGLGHGHGHLQARRARVRVAGRRMPRSVERELLLPGPDGLPQLLVAPAEHSRTGIDHRTDHRIDHGLDLVG